MNRTPEGDFHWDPENEVFTGSYTDPLTGVVSVREVDQKLGITRRINTFPNDNMQRIITEVASETNSISYAISYREGDALKRLHYMAPLAEEGRPSFYVDIRPERQSTADSIHPTATYDVETGSVNDIAIFMALKSSAAGEFGHLTYGEKVNHFVQRPLDDNLTEFVSTYTSTQASPFEEEEVELLEELQDHPVMEFLREMYGINQLDAFSRWRWPDEVKKETEQAILRIVSDAFLPAFLQERLPERDQIALASSAIGGIIRQLPDTFDPSLPHRDDKIKKALQQDIVDRLVQHYEALSSSGHLRVGLDLKQGEEDDYGILIQDLSIHTHSRPVTTQGKIGSLYQIGEHSLQVDRDANNVNLTIASIGKQKHQHIFGFPTQVDIEKFLRKASIEANTGWEKAIEDINVSYHT